MSAQSFNERRNITQAIGWEERVGLMGGSMGPVGRYGGAGPPCFWQREGDSEPAWRGELPRERGRGRVLESSGKLFKKIFTNYSKLFTRSLNTFWPNALNLH